MEVQVAQVTLQRFSLQLGLPAQYWEIRIELVTVVVLAFVY